MVNVEIITSPSSQEVYVPHKLELSWEGEAIADLSYDRFVDALHQVCEAQIEAGRDIQLLDVQFSGTVSK